MQTDKKLLHISKRKFCMQHIEKWNQMYTPLLQKAEEASKHIFQAVGICPVPICSDELVKK